MAAKITTRGPTEEDILYLAENMRQCDVDELYATLGLSPLEAIRLSIKNSKTGFVYAGFADGVLGCIGGAAVGSFLTDTAYPWLLGTNLLNSHSKSFTKGGHAVVRMMLRQWPILTNVVDARNVASIRWLKRLGFVFDEPYTNERGFKVMRFTHESSKAQRDSGS